MKRVFIPFALLFLAACAIPTPTLIPKETIVAQTLAAMAAQEESLPAADTPIPPEDMTVPPSLTPTSPTDIDPNIPGAQCVPTNTARLRALVSRVIDGQTIEVSIDNTPYMVRYIGLAAPGVNPVIEWMGPQAIAVNSDLVSGKFVILVKDVSETDSAGLLLRYVLVDNIFVNYELIRKGFARALVVTPDVACGSTFLAAQSEAQSALLGVWSPTPLPTSSPTSTPTPTKIPTNTLSASPSPPPCSCNRHYTCNNFSSQAAAQACYEYCGPGVGLIDKNNNGRVCEGLP